MNNLRQAAQQALEALEQSRVFVTTREKIKHPEGAEWYDERITALKQALAESEQPHDFLCVCGAEWDIHSDGREELVAAPTPRKPLTEDQIVDIWAGVSMGYDDQINIIELARALERAHGIGEQHD